MTEDQEYKIDQADRAAREVKQLLDHPRLQEAMTRLEDIYIKNWRETPQAQQEDRERIYYRIRALDELRHDLQAVIEGSKVLAYNSRVARKAKKG